MRLTPLKEDNPFNNITSKQEDYTNNKYSLFTNKLFI